ncbi:MAG: o-succinylbenzoate synthase [Proteobacteria bacterium]|nr:o-succinylbenzoate synthase [Pseudomonadota bacterium]
MSRRPLIRRARLHAYRLRLVKPLATARGESGWRDGWLLELEDEEGLVGVGDASPWPLFGGGDPAACEERLHAFGAAITRDAASSDAWLANTAAWPPAAAAAATTAWLDLEARREGRPLAALRGGRVNAKVPVNALLAAREGVELEREARTALEDGFRCLKLKVGDPDPARDVERVAAVRRAVGSACALRLDANGAWDAETARTALERFEPYNPEWVEEPLRDATPESLAALRAHTAIPVAADENARDARAIEALCEREAVDVVVLKPAWLGGPRAAWQCAVQVHEAGVEPVVTSALDSAVGVAMALHVAAALACPVAAGLATASWLRDDLCPAPERDGAYLVLPAGPGLGVSVDPERLAAAATGAPREWQR